MNNAVKRKNLSPSEANRTIARINRLRIAFTQINPPDQTKVIELILAEIETIEDESIKLWLVKFRSILDAVKTEETV